MEDCNVSYLSSAIIVTRCPAMILMMRSSNFSCPIPSYGRNEAESIVTQTGKKKKTLTKIKWTKEGVNGMENSIMDTDH